MVQGRLVLLLPIVFPILIVVFVLSLSDMAAAVSCRSLQQQLNMAQVSRDSPEVQRVYRRLASGGCLSGQRSARDSDEWWDGVLGARPSERPRREARPSERPRREASRPRRSARAAAREPRRSIRETNPRRAKGGKRGISIAKGTFRTLCVRACDGYYFPISFSTRRDRFAADQEVCSQICPAAKASIYYHPVGKEGVESMVALDGSAYADLATAFKYRTNLDPSCTCGRPKVVAEMNIGAATDASAAPVEARLPRPRTEPGEDPETLANRDGHFIPHAMRRMLLAESEPGAPGQIHVIDPQEPVPVMMSAVPNNFPFDTGLLPEEPASVLGQAGPAGPTLGRRANPADPPP